MKSSLYPRPLAFVLKLSIAALAVTGFAQMPIFNRYYVSDVPGLGWLAAYYVTHTIHYVAAAVFLGLAAYGVAVFARARGAAGSVTPSGRLRLAVVAVIIASGLLRAAKNRPDVDFPPAFVFTIDLVHLGAVVLWGLLALAATWLRRRPYLAANGRAGRRTGGPGAKGRTGRASAAAAPSI